MSEQTQTQTTQESATSPLFHGDCPKCGKPFAPATSQAQWNRNIGVHNAAVHGYKSQLGQTRRERAGKVKVDAPMGPSGALGDDLSRPMSRAEVLALTPRQKAERKRLLAKLHKQNQRRTHPESPEARERRRIWQNLWYERVRKRKMRGLAPLPMPNKEVYLRRELDRLHGATSSVGETNQAMERQPVAAKPPVLERNGAITPEPLERVALPVKLSECPCCGAKFWATTTAKGEVGHED